MSLLNYNEQIPLEIQLKLQRQQLRRQHGSFDLLTAITLALIVIPTVTVLLIRSTEAHNRSRREISLQATKAQWDKEKMADADCKIAADLGATQLIKCKTTDGDLIDEILVAVDAKN